MLSASSNYVHPPWKKTKDSRCACAGVCVCFYIIHADCKLASCCRTGSDCSEFEVQRSFLFPKLQVFRMETFSTVETLFLFCSLPIICNSTAARPHCLLFPPSIPYCIRLNYTVCTLCNIPTLPSCISNPRAMSFFFLSFINFFTLWIYKEMP